MALFQDPALLTANERGAGGKAGSARSFAFPPRLCSFCKSAGGIAAASVKDPESPVSFYKLSAAQLRQNVDNYMKSLLETWEELPPYFVTSSEKKQGREPLLNYIEGIIGNTCS